jgi:hypothetical protein
VAARIPLGPPTDLTTRRAINAVAEELRLRRLRQSDHVAADQVRAAECCQESIEAIEQELQFLAGPR